MARPVRVWGRGGPEGWLARAPVEYPAGWQTRQVSPGGQIRWNQAYVFVGRALSGEPIGLELVGDGKWRVWFSFYELGIFEENKLLIRAKPSKPQTSKS